MNRPAETAEEDRDAQHENWVEVNTHPKRGSGKWYTESQKSWSPRLKPWRNKTNRLATILLYLFLFASLWKHSKKQLFSLF